MSETEDNADENRGRSSRLRIWQQNLNKSPDAQSDLIHKINDYDIMLIQEPYIDFLGNNRATRAWTTLYPTRHRDEASVLVIGRFK